MALAAVAIGISSTSCRIVKKSNYHNLKNETRTMELPDFNAISNDFMCDIKYTQGPTSFKVSAPKMVLDVMTVEVRDSILVISSKNNDIHVNKIENMQIICSSPSMKSVAVNGLGDFEWEGGVAGDMTMAVNGMGDLEWKNGHCESLKLYVNGMGDINCENIAGTDLTGVIAGRGDIDVSGEFQHGTLNISGMGDINIKKLNCPDLNTTVDGMGSIKK